MLNKLRKQLSKLGINKAQADPVMVNGTQCIYVRWNGDEEIFAGYDEDNYFDEAENARRLSRFRDDNLS